MTISVRGVTFRYPARHRDVLRDVSLDVRQGELVAVTGPNGGGKTTLLKIALGRLAPATGIAEIDGRAVGSWSRRALARVAAVLPQSEQVAFPIRVRDAVMFGRYPHLSSWGGEGPRDRDAVSAALERCDAADLAERWVHTLSGGEWQRVRIARALAQEPRILILDEPASSLDIRHAMEVFDLVASLARDAGMAVLVVTHHINLAARFASRMLVLAGGVPVALGAPAEVMRSDLLESAFGWPVEILSVRGVPQFYPLRRGE